MIRLFLFILLVYFSLLLCTYFLRWKLIFHPTAANPFYLHPWKKYEVFFKNVTGWMCHPPTTPKNPIVIYFGGNAENVANNLNEITRFKDISFMLMNYRGYNDAPGTPSQENVFADALTTYDQLVDVYKISPSQIFLIGRSLGGAVAAYVASKRKVQGIILVTPFDQIKNVVKGIFLLLPFVWILDNNFKTIRYMKENSADVLILSAEKDEIIPQNCIQNLVNTIKQPLSFKEIKGANHQNITEFDDYYNAINLFINARIQ